LEAGPAKAAREQTGEAGVTSIRKMTKKPHGKKKRRRWKKREP